VVGVIDQRTSDVESSANRAASASPNGVAQSSVSPNESSDNAGVAGSGINGTDPTELLVVAGLPLHDWPGPTFEWPLGVRLRSFFSDSSWPGRSGPPDQVEREAFQRMGVYSDQRHDDVRFVASKGDVAEALRELFSEATLAFGGEPRSLVTRDAWGDEYMVVLGTASCARPPSHHGDPCEDVSDGSSGTEFPGR
jgi:hypothetical protein